MEACKELREKYEDCFNIWFSEKFLKGNNNDSMCASLLKVYTECVEKAMKEQQIELKDVELNYLEDDKKDESGS
ncbi:TP53-regulated inhibitor of apoptosis 1-like isoform X2 [Belonocnema kinseyi]|uniref:TP53-regulated inhibitor of apoptosis 1-like isoform X2 n=1 Tax=Belonocnema kinseyi TaxID=2817044 RepID=UPI00143D71B8|nr:TP53-regulated inhibitor of apoptosis 1-like isoform X2 [Belonocnema kinseyi]